MIPDLSIRIRVDGGWDYQFLCGSTAVTRSTPMLGKSDRWRVDAGVSRRRQVCSELCLRVSNSELENEPEAGCNREARMRQT